MIEKYFYRIFLLNILRDSKIDLIFANIKRTFKKHFLRSSDSSKNKLLHIYFPIIL